MDVPIYLGGMCSCSFVHWFTRCAWLCQCHHCTLYTITFRSTYFHTEIKHYTLYYTTRTRAQINLVLLWCEYQPNRTVRYVCLPNAHAGLCLFKIGHSLSLSTPPSLAEWAWCTFVAAYLLSNCRFEIQILESIELITNKCTSVEKFSLLI